MLRFFTPSHLKGFTQENKKISGFLAKLEGKLKEIARALKKIEKILSGFKDLGQGEEGDMKREREMCEKLRKK